MNEKKQLSTFEKLLSAKDMLSKPGVVGIDLHKLGLKDTNPMVLEFVNLHSDLILAKGQLVKVDRSKVIAKELALKKEQLSFNLKRIAALHKENERLEEQILELTSSTTTGDSNDI